MRQACFLIFILCITQTFATILTVDNHIPSIGQYSTIQAAHDAAMDGDDIYVYPSVNTYVGATITKHVHIYGGGWNMHIPVNGAYDTIAGGFTFSAGSESSSISGMQINGTTISANSISITHCYLPEYQLLGINASDVIVRENKLWVVHVNPGQYAVEISKNLIYGYDYWGWWQAYNNQDWGYAAIHVESGCDVHIYQNIMFNYYSTSVPNWSGIYLKDGFADVVNNTIIQNGAMDHGSIYCYGANPVLINNISTNGDLNGPISHHNVLDDNPTAHFVDIANWNFHLAPGSPAIGAGENGIDCGAYGGVSPFNDNYNTPELPTIIQLQTPTTIVPAEQPMPVTIRARTND